MPWTALVILWVPLSICCGRLHRCPHHILFVFSTAYPPHHIHFVLSTAYATCRPHYIQMFSTAYTPYAVENQGFQYFMLWVTFVYGVVVSIPCIWCGLPIYAVGIWCGHHRYMLWVTWDMVWIYAVEYIFYWYMLWVSYAVDYRSPHHIWPVVHGIYMLWVYAVGTHELCRWQGSQRWHTCLVSERNETETTPTPGTTRNKQVP